jgi:hypothetical protein
MTKTTNSAEMALFLDGNLVTDWVLVALEPSLDLNPPYL